MTETGFSLVEMMVAVAIILIGRIIAIPNFQTWLGYQRLRSDVAQVEGDLQAARITRPGQTGG